MASAVFVAEFFSHVDTQDFEWVRDHLTEDCLITDPGFLGRGKDAVVKWMAGFISAFPDMRHRPYQILADKDKAAFLVEVTGTHTNDLALPDGILAATNRSLQLTICEFWQFTDNKVSEYRVIFDRATFLAQLGVSLQPAPS